MHKQNKGGLRFRTILAIFAVLFLIGGMISGSIAWLTSRSTTITNTFTVGNVDITLIEHQYDAAADELTDDVVEANTYPMVPGVVYPKDPTVTVEAGSEDCYLFVALQEVDTIVDGVEVLRYTLRMDSENWNRVEDNRIAEGVTIWYRTVETDDEDQSWNLIVGTAAGTATGEAALDENQIQINPALLKDQMDSMTEEGIEPQLIFQACAVQMDTITVTDAITTAIGLLTFGNP